MQGNFVSHGKKYGFKILCDVAFTILYCDFFNSDFEDFDNTMFFWHLNFKCLTFS